MNIGFFLGKKFPNLSETFIINQITGLIDRGHCVDIYADSPGTDPKTHRAIKEYQLLQRTHYRVDFPKNYFVRFLKGIYLAATNFSKNPSKVLQSINIFNQKGRTDEILSLRYLYEIIPSLNRIEYDIIQCHFGHNALKCLALRKYGVLQGKLVTTFHGADISKLLRKREQDLYSELFEEGDLFLPVCDTWKMKMIALGCAPDKVIVHHMGVDCNSFTFKSRVVDQNRKVKIVTVCRLVEKKGVEYGIRSIAELAKMNPNIRYDIIGDGPLRNMLSQLIIDLGIVDFVKLHGWQDKHGVIAALERAHIMLAPSVTGQDGDQEGIPVALMEAMAIGIPVVSTLHSGIPELIENHISGLLVPERDFKQMADKAYFLIQNPGAYENIAMAARRRIETDFNIFQLTLKLENIFSSLK